jgi:hypothetical protein
MRGALLFGLLDLRLLGDVDGLLRYLDAEAVVGHAVVLAFIRCLAVLVSESADVSEEHGLPLMSPLGNRHWRGCRQPKSTMSKQIEH